jgi:3,4-dihydroxy 2-butanone 4-phosphate synthase/GTP cyclohydrolase II
MSTVAAAAERFAAGELVLVGDDCDEAIFIAVAAATITPQGLADLQELGRGTVVLGMTESTVERLRLYGPAGRPLGGEGLRMITPIDAASRDGGGWSLSDRAHTMRVAAQAESQPQDLLVPGHVLTAQIEEHGHGAAAAVVELARIAGPGSTVALSAVLDARGGVARLGDAVRSSQLRRLAHVSSAELRSHAVARETIELAVGCDLPTRDGRFRAIAFGARDSAPAPARHPDPYVHVHVACRLGDTFGSLLCSCRAELDAATERILAEGCGVIIYAPSPDPVQMTCAHDQPIDDALVSGLLRAIGVEASQPAVEVLARVDPHGRGQLEAAA